MTSINEILRDHKYEVVVGNIGIVYSGFSLMQALEDFKRYVGYSKSGEGRCAYESVVMFQDGEITQEHIDPNDTLNWPSWDNE
jgi:hypothetical protein